jgi:hypothetical protein
MKKIILLTLITLAMSSHLFSQGIYNIDADNSAFPQISIDFSLRNPNVLEKGTFALTENGKPVDFELLNKPDSVLYLKSTILILFENSHWTRFEKQRNYGKDLFSKVFTNLFENNVNVYLATFDWTIDKADDFKLLHKDPINDYNQFKETLNKIEKPAKDGRLHESTEIFPAVLDALDFLNSKKSADEAPALLLFSSEFDNFYNKQQTKIDAITKARNLNIPIFTIQYPHYHEKYNLHELSTETFGERVVADINDVENTARKLIEKLEKIPSLASGKNYTIQFTTSNKANGNSHILKLDLSQLEQYNIQYSTPAFFKYFFSKKSNIAWVSAVALVLILILAGLIIFNNKKKQKEKAEQDQKLQQIKQHSEEALAQKEDEWAKREKEKEENLKLEAQKQKEKEFQKMLNEQFKASKVFPSISLEKGPRLEIDNPVYTIGRADNNCLKIDIQSVSRNHAVIAFAHKPDSLSLDAQKAYFIWDNGSSNGTKVNGKLVPKAEDIKFGKEPYILKNNDLVELGELKFIFNI